MPGTSYAVALCARPSSSLNSVLLFITPPQQKCNERFPVLDLSVADELIEFFLFEPALLDALVLHRSSFSLRETGGEKQVHFLRNVARTGPPGGNLLPFLRCVPGLLGEFPL